MGLFEKKIALVTGASSGIGKATAMRFAEEGATVVLADVQEDAGKQTATDISAATKSETLFVRCDVSQPKQVEELIALVIERFGRIDAAFNNAGIEGAPAATHECTLENWTRTIDINLRGIWLCMKHEIPHMLKQESGSIVNCASIAGLVGFANLPAYTASKHGVIGLTRTAALEYARQGLRINAVCPGVIDTPMVQRFTQGNAEALDQLTSGEPVGRLGKPEEIGDAVIWLCSPRSSFVTGQALAVDGGWVAQ